MCISLYIYIYIYICTYVCIEREREREYYNAERNDTNMFLALDVSQ